MAIILITGADGQLGRELYALQFMLPHTLIPTDVADLDITDGEAVDRLVDECKIDVIINCAAYTAVDKAESEPEAARLINAVGPANLAAAAAKHGSMLIHISTDYVFDGRQQTPYTEDDPASPLGIYGQTKLAGEEAIRRSGCKGIILRTSWLYSEYGSNFVKTMLKMGEEKDEIRVVDDQWGSPTHATDLAAFILCRAVPQLMATPQYGEVYNFSDMGSTTWRRLAERVMELAGLTCRVIPIATAEFPTAARRPQYSLLDKSKVLEYFNITIPSWEESLKDCIDKLVKT